MSRSYTRNWSNSSGLTFGLWGDCWPFRRNTLITSRRLGGLGVFSKLQACSFAARRANFYWERVNTRKHAAGTSHVSRDHEYNLFIFFYFFFVATPPFTFRHWTHRTRVSPGCLLRLRASTRRRSSNFSTSVAFVFSWNNWALIFFYHSYYIFLNNGLLRFNKGTHGEPCHLTWSSNAAPK